MLCSTLILFHHLLLLFLIHLSLSFTPLPLFPPQPTTSRHAIHCGATSSSEEQDLLKIDLEKLYEAADTRKVEKQDVLNSLLSSEKLVKKMNKKSPPSTSPLSSLTSNLTGEWRLIFTTGETSTQNILRTTSGSYFPIKAVQSFDVPTLTIKNAIYAGSLPLIKFQGPFIIKESKAGCKVVFDFTSIRLFDVITIPLSNEDGVDLSDKGKPFFTWLVCDDRISTARGKGGGIALWRRI
eukprot:CAMPEP_0118661060 /NCGR_PEP_ID=MMETSP0785-20121206/16060_1 /TAXON_ID=91992 /ORGANISM="Bolidomonas pacifica, Strain CCMP 1866" /LENGTH=237 /DNA_ID=CAMNT_0006554439 /DNA_START=152 /DNA_END=865 /DNA_ORIENTATION=+